jgi:hypothetical protein
MMDMAVVLNCSILEETEFGALIEADLGRAWFDKAEFEIVSRGREIDQIRISDLLATERGIW